MNKIRRPIFFSFIFGLLLSTLPAYAAKCYVETGTPVSQPAWRYLCDVATSVSSTGGNFYCPPNHVLVGLYSSAGNSLGSCSWICAPLNISCH